MAVNVKLQGGVVVSTARHSHGVIELLTARMRNRLHISYYNHPFEIEVERRHQFLIVFSVEDLDGVVKCYRAKGEPTPLIVHVDLPQVLAQMDYTRYFPRVEIVSIEQAATGQNDITLKLHLFQEIVEHLEARASR
ncbi:MAG TPA: hypothetical protein VHP83_09330 [Aggregatilineaceae bacterium]|nr:hypothetical protein [Aggregatilineaceae bacterium]